jgi:HK97 family phage portal protein
VRSLIGSLLNKAPVPYVNRTSAGLLGMMRGTDDASAMQAYGDNSTLFAIVTRICEACMSVDWQLYRKTASGLEADRKPVAGHAALDLWNNPNPFYTRQQFVEQSTQHLALTGKTFWVLYRTARSGPPLEIWPVRPDRIHPVKDPDKFITGWLYKLGQDEVPLRLDEVIWQRTSNPLDPYGGLGAVTALGTDLDSSRLAGEYNRSFFHNSALPGGIAEVDRRLSDDEFDELTARWDEQHRGVSRAHRVAILENGLKWVERKYTMRDMQFTELRSDAREVIREGFGFPKALLGSVDDINRANAEANEVVFGRWLVVPRLERMKGALNHGLLPLYGDYSRRSLEFDYSNPVPDDVTLANETLTAKVDAAVKLVAEGWEPAAVLEYLDLPPLPFIGKPSIPEPAVGRDDVDLAALVNGNGHLARR